MSLPGGGSPLVIGVLILVFLCAAGAFFIFGGGLTGEAPASIPQTVSVGEQPVAAPQEQLVTPVAAPAEDIQLALPQDVGPNDTWLVMLYQDADDKILERDIFLDLNEAERIGSTDNVHIVAQVDRYRGGYSGDGNWTSAKRFYVTQGSDLDQVTSEELMDLGEVNMSDGQTLVDFVTWAVENYPAQKHALIMSDHGMGWPGGWSDPDPQGRAEDVPLASALGDQLYLMEIDSALSQIRQNTGIDRLELVGMDACLMSHLEVFEALSPHARYAVASQETEPAIGWAYAGFLKELVENPAMSGEDLGRSIVRTYIQDDQRIVDDRLRAELAGRGLLGSPSAAQVAGQMEESVTLTAIDLAAMPAVMGSMNDLVYSLQSVGQREVAEARNYAQSYTSVFGREVPPSYIDLGHFAQLLSQTVDQGEIGEAARKLVQTINEAVIAERHGRKKPGSSGISIYFPNSQLYGNPLTGASSYASVATRFVENSLWDDFLAYHYAGRAFEATDRGAAVSAEDTQAPATGEIEISAVELSSDSVFPGDTVLLSVDVTGDNIGYIKLFAGFLDEASNSVFVADTDFLESPDTRELNGVFYPVWPEDEFTVEFEWEPVVFAIDDGRSQVVAAFNPQTYGATFEEAVYTVDGRYAYVDGEERLARMYFSDGVMTQVLGFAGEGSTGAPREITPSEGDQFTVVDTWLDLDTSGRVTGRATQNGGTLTFGDQPLTWIDLDAAPGAYIVGFVVEDLDGISRESLAPIAVE